MGKWASWLVLLVAACGGAESEGASAGEAGALSTAALDEQTPYVLLHGFFGWGRDELLGFRHFGGTQDLEAELSGAGFRTVTVAVGPLSSNWDRAAELYAQLLGGTVDYGRAHAEQHGHARFGRTHEPLLPELGTTRADGSVRRVHIIAHSQGAQTARVLIALLADGSDAERAACPGGACPDGTALSPLFAGAGPVWVHGLATLSGASDGSTLAHALQHEANPNRLVAMLAAATSALGASGLYDFKLDQWGLGPRAPGEPLDAYVTRITSTMLDEHNRDTAFYDLSLDGAAELNAWARARPDVHYLAWANHTSVPITLLGAHRPLPATNLFLMGFTSFMGGYRPAGVDARLFWENDGIVNSFSMEGPTLASTDLARAFDGVSRPGVWQLVERRRGWDHWDMLGLLDLEHASGDVRALYLDVAAQLRDTE